VNICICIQICECATHDLSVCVLRLSCVCVTCVSCGLLFNSSKNCMEKKVMRTDMYVNMHIYIHIYICERVTHDLSVCVLRLSCVCVTCVSCGMLFNSLQNCMEKKVMRADIYVNMHIYIHIYICERVTHDLSVCVPRLLSVCVTCVSCGMLFNVGKLHGKEGYDD